jgi:hypothetical protein
MPIFKCLACETRLYKAAGPDDLAGDLCPGCGSLLEPAGEPAEVAGFRSIGARASAADVGAAGTHQRIADRFGDFVARREAFLAQARLDARRWVDRCRCDHLFQVFGGGRHRRFYELDDPRWERPVMTRLCPSCQRRLPTTPGPLALEMQP